MRSPEVTAVFRDRRQPCLPVAEPGALRRAVRRTTLSRWLLAVALACSLGAAFLVARSRDAKPDPILPVGSTGMIVLDLSASAGLPPGFGELLRRVAAANEKLGVVVFSDGAYELVPPGTPGRVLEPMLRFFTEESTANPWEAFQMGTNLASGIDLAREVLERDRIQRGTILVASDLEFVPDDAPRLVTAIGEVRRIGGDLRILPLGAREEQRRFFAALVGNEVFVELDEATSLPAGRAAGPFRLAEEGMPWLFLALAFGLVLLLAANEHSCARLRLPPREEVRA